jgi:hypothetical protein
VNSQDRFQGFHFVSFGSDWRYRVLARTTLRQLCAVYPSATRRVWSPRDLSPALRSLARRYPRGFGLWAWKPFILEQCLSECPEGDIVVYVDGRSGIPNQPVHWLSRMREATAIDVAAWQMKHTELTWTRSDLLKEFGIRSQDDHAQSGQFAAGMIAVRNSPAGRSLVHEWLSMMLSKPNLYDDGHSTLPNHASFIESRHDQSVFSLLLKTHQQTGLLVLTLSDDDIYHPRSIRPHGKQHPSRWFPLRELGRFVKHLAKWPLRNRRARPGSL